MQNSRKAPGGRRPLESKNSWNDRPHLLQQRMKTSERIALLANRRTTCSQSLTETVGVSKLGYRQPPPHYKTPSCHKIPFKISYIRFTVNVVQEKDGLTVHDVCYFIHTTSQKKSRCRPIYCIQMVLGSKLRNSGNLLATQLYENRSCHCTKMSTATKHQFACDLANAPRRATSTVSCRPPAMPRPTQCKL